MHIVRVLLKFSRSSMSTCPRTYSRLPVGLWPNITRLKIRGPGLISIYVSLEDVSPSAHVNYHPENNL